MVGNDSGLQEGVRGTFEHQAGQDAAVGGSGIDADPVVADHRLGADAVTVHDDCAVVRLGFKKGAADPHAVVVILPSQRHPGADARMNETVVAGSIADLQRPEKLKM